MGSTNFSISQSLAEEWNNALRDEIPKRSNLHARNKALFLLWKDASHGRREDANTLSDLLKQRFRFEVELFEIPLEESQNALNERMMDFTGSTGTSSSLALVYYSGNGDIKHDCPFWIPDSKLQPEVDWFAVQGSLEACPADVVLLFDCSHRTMSSKNGKGGGNSCFRRVTKASNGRMEILTTPSSLSGDDTSFRRALIKTLTETSGESVSIDQLRRKLYRLLGGTSDPDYLNLSRGSNRSSIAILPSEKVNLDMTIKKSMNSGNQQGLKNWASKAPRQIKTLRFLAPEDKGGDDHANHVLIEVDVASQIDLEKDTFSSWAKLVPTYVENIKIQGSTISTKAKTGDESFNAIIQTWNQNIRLRTGLTTREGRYERIVVLPMKWLKEGFIDGSVISQELHDLGEVFRTSFDNCEIRPVFEIPTGRHPIQPVTFKVIETLHNLKSSDLLIVVYNGHGNDTLGQTGQCVLSGAGEDSYLDWNLVQPLLHDASCDVAQILDCCFAGNAVKGNIEGRNEILTACEGDVKTPSGPQAYIKRLTVVLRDLVSEAQVFSLLTVHERLKAEVEQLNNGREQYNGSKSDLLTPPVRGIIPDSSDSITLRPKIIKTDQNQHGGHDQGVSQDDNSILGLAYFEMSVRIGDDQKDWKDIGFRRILNREEMLKELQGQAVKIPGPGGQS